MSILKLYVSEKYKHIGAAFSGNYMWQEKQSHLLKVAIFFCIKNT